VGTVTEIYDYLRLPLRARGPPHCSCLPASRSRPEQESIVDQILQLAEGTKFTVERAGRP